MQAEVTILYVNDPKPGKKFGSIKTEQLGYIGVHPTKLPLFRRGGKYIIEYKDDGQYKNFVSMIREAAPEAPTPGKPNGAASSSYGQPKSPEESLAIFATGVVQCSMKSGKFGIDDIGGLTRAAVGAFRLYVQGKPVDPPLQPARPAPYQASQAIRDYRAPERAPERNAHVDPLDGFDDPPFDDDPNRPPY